jgi:hypothetical protein
VVNRLKPYTFHLALALYWPVLLYADAHVLTLAGQHVLGMITFGCLFLATRFSPRSERRRVWVMVGIATIVELLCSVVWGLYTYRWGNVPLFVPWGHGLIYLFALRAARTPLMVNYDGPIRCVALTCATMWVICGLTVVPFFTGRLDVVGALLWPIFAWFMRRPSAMVYAASFLITTELELVGTGFGNWTWSAEVPGTHLSAGNPPAVIAGAYCVLDSAAAKVTARLPLAGMFFSGGLSRLRSPSTRRC